MKLYDRIPSSYHRLLSLRSLTRCSVSSIATDPPLITHKKIAEVFIDEADAPNYLIFVSLDQPTNSQSYDADYAIQLLEKMQQ